MEGNEKKAIQKNLDQIAKFWKDTKLHSTIESRLLLAELLLMLSLKDTDKVFSLLSAIKRAGDHLTVENLQKILKSRRLESKRGSVI